MSNNKEELPLRGEPIVFTGSKEPAEAVQAVENYGGKAIYLPLIETIVIESETPDLSPYDWLIFTSRTSAEAFGKLKLQVKCKIAAVGERTVATLLEYGYLVDFMPSVYSADRFVAEFPKQVKDAKCLFVKGSLAKNTIASMPMQVDEWLIYETKLSLENAKQLILMKDAIIIFASPSAVAAYRQAGGNWQHIRVAAIGHVTQKAIVHEGGHVNFVPKKYTYLDVISEIAKGS